MDEDVMNRAAFSGNLELVQWLRGEGCPCDWNAWTCDYAAAAGQLEVLQWLRAEGCPWGVGTCYIAVEKGHVEVLRWARENGCPWSTWVWDRAELKLGYTDDLGNLDEGLDPEVLMGHPLIEDGDENDEFSEDESPEQELMLYG